MRFNKVISAVLFASAFTITSCSQIDELEGQSQNDGKNILQISVTDAGVYGDSPARAVEDGYKTTFEAGDAIGVYGIKGGTLLVENKKFTLQEDGTWKVLGESIQFVEEEMGEAKFYAYYPYKAEGVQFNVGVELAGDPFAEAVNSWSIGTDLTEKKYTQYDLMTSKVTKITPSGALGEVNFVLNHRMSIAAISLPGKVYTFDNTDIKIEPYTLPATQGVFKVKQGAEEKVVAPYYDKKNGLYRILVKPNMEYTVSGTYVLEKKKEYTSTRIASECKEGKAVKFNIKGSIEKTHILQVGDYYCADGSIVGKDETAPSNAIGVVFFVGNPQPSVVYSYTEYQDIMRSDFPDCKHGLVIALNDANNGNTTRFSNSSKGVYVDDFKKTYEDGARYFDLSFNSAKNPMPLLLEMKGYSNTKLMKITQQDEVYGKRSDLMCSILAAYESSVSTLSLTTGWFCPSFGEFSTIIKNYDTIKASVEAANGNLEQYPLTGDMNKDKGAYWASTIRSDAAQWISGLNAIEEDGKKASFAANASSSTVQHFRFCLAF